ncbi:unnamed protein product [Camellia sinensis]
MQGISSFSKVWHFGSDPGEKSFFIETRYSLSKEDLTVGILHLVLSSLPKVSLTGYLRKGTKKQAYRFVLIIERKCSTQCTKILRVSLTWDVGPPTFIG